MNQREIRRILKDNDFIHESGTPEELRVAEYLQAKCQALGAETHLEAFDVEMTKVHVSRLSADGRDYPCQGFRLCGSGVVEAPFLYLPSTDPISLREARGKIVLLDTGVTHFLYQDLLEAGIAGFITYTGSVFFRDRDIDQKELRSYVSLGKKTLGVNLNAKDAAQLVRQNPKTVRIEVQQDEFPGQSHNVVAMLPGEREEFLLLSAHYDTTALSRGSYDNMTGCIGLLSVLDTLRGKKLRYGLRFVFCGSEERGLLGSKAYAEAHEEELKRCALNINLDMIGSSMGKFIACVSAEEALVSYLGYLGGELGWPIEAKMGVYSSDSTPFADKGVPALSFARMAPRNQSNIHTRYDTMAVLSEEQILRDSQFVAEFTRRMAQSVQCPVSRNIPDRVKTELDEYLNRKRKG